MTYFCQLGQFRNTKRFSVGEYNGLFVWVIAKRSELAKLVESSGKRYTEISIRLCLLAVDPLYPRELASTPAETIELLPYFKNTEPIAEEAWLAKGGEEIPEEGFVSVDLR